MTAHTAGAQATDLYAYAHPKSDARTPAHGGQAARNPKPLTKPGFRRQCLRSAGCFRTAFAPPVATTDRRLNPNWIVIAATITQWAARLARIMHSGKLGIIGQGRI